MKFIGLKLLIVILEITAFLLITPCLIFVGWAFFNDDHMFNGQSLTQAGIALAVVGGVLLTGLLIGAIASLLNLLLAIEKNTADIAANTRRPTPVQVRPIKPSWFKQVFTPIRPSVPAVATTAEPLPISPEAPTI